MSGDMATEIDRGYLPPEIRAAATAYLTRSGNADLLPILGLTPDPVAAEMSAAKAKGMLRGHGLPSARARGVCPICQNKLPGHGVCRKRQACREAARERGESA